MPQINLIYDKQVAVRQNERKVRALFFTSVGIGLVSVLLFGSLSLQAEVIGHDESELNLRLSKLKPLVVLTEANEKLTNTLLPRLQTLENAQKTSDKWAHILAHFTRNTPEGVWLTGVKAANDDPKKAISVAFDGKGGDQKLIADLILRAESLPDLTNVNLKYSELRPGSEGDAIEFEISADVVGTEPPVAAKPAGSGT